jgi:hypothetical protein
MPRYAITEKAGRFVAGQTNNGAGTVLELTEKQAEHEVRLGTLVPLDVETAEEAAETGTEGDKKAEKAPTPPKGKKAAPAPAQGAQEGGGGNA